MNCMPFTLSKLEYEHIFSIFYIISCIYVEGTTLHHMKHMQNGDTALILAASGGHQNCVRLLVDAGANTEAKNKVLDTAELLLSFVPVLHAYVGRISYYSRFVEKLRMHAHAHSVVSPRAR